MRNAIAIARKELNIYFATPIAYVVFTVFVVFGSFFFLRLLGAYEQATLEAMRYSPEMAGRLNFQDFIFRNLLHNQAIVLIFVVPFLTMRLIAEEKKQKTLELLQTTPLAPGAIVWGKYLASLGVLAFTIGLTLLYPALVQIFAKDAAGVEWRSVLLGYLGLLLLGGAYLSIGLFVSALTESQVVAALITFFVLLMFLVIGLAANETEGNVRDVVSYLASGSHLDSFTRGTLDLKDVVYFLSLTAVGLFATHRAVDAHRWS